FALKDSQIKRPDKPSPLHMRDIKPFLVADALADFSRDEHLWTLRYAASRCGVVTDTQSMLNSIESDLVKGGN
ncbi:MAG: hypothetical protein ACTIA3_01375, partial [Corynebacterium casei]